MAQYNTPSAKVNAYLATTDALTNERDQLSQDRYRTSQSLLEQSRQVQDRYEFDLEYQMKKRAEDVQIAERKRQLRNDELMAKAFRSNLPTNLLDQKLSDEEMLAEKIKQAGYNIMRVDPRAGLEYLKQSTELVGKAKKQEIDHLTLMDKKLELKADVAASVNDPNSAMLAVNRMAELGETVPEKFRGWTPESQAWWARRAQMSKTQQALTKTRVAEERAALEARNTNSQIETREAKQKLDEQKQTLARDRITQSRTKKLQTLPEKDRKRDLAFFAEENEAFDNLDKELQNAVVSDIAALTLMNMQNDPTLDQGVAKARAAREVLSLISPDGTYNRDSGAGQAPQQAVDMLKSNPALAPQFKAKYGYLPEGY